MAIEWSEGQHAWNHVFFFFRLGIYMCTVHVNTVIVVKYPCVNRLLAHVENSTNARINTRA